MLVFEYEGFNPEYHCYYKQYGDSGWITVKVFLNDGMKGFSIEYDDYLFSYYLGKYSYMGIDNTRFYNMPILKLPKNEFQKEKIIKEIISVSNGSDMPKYYLDFILKIINEYH